jgi:flavin reductase (DIM6/NTAB) family NADH-FMN oxidoreductase RutF
MKLLTSDLTTVEKQHYLQHLVAPRPIALASTIGKDGSVNLSPFSFFNLFSNNPPIVVFSPVRRVRDNTTKHSLENILEVPEVVINIVTYDMVHQVSLASCEFPKGTDEFEKAGFTKEKASIVKPPLVKEAKAKLECAVKEVKALGNEGGAGQLVIAEVVCIHINDDLLDEHQHIDQEKLELVARLGGDWYTKVSAENLFKVPKPNRNIGIGMDALPAQIRNSTVLTGNHLAQLANVERMPEREINFHDGRLDALFYYFKGGNQQRRIHHYAKELLEEGRTAHAWQVLLYQANVKEHAK